MSNECDVPECGEDTTGPAVMCMCYLLLFVVVCCLFLCFVIGMCPEGTSTENYLRPSGEVASLSRFSWNANMGNGGPHVCAWLFVSCELALVPQFFGPTSMSPAFRERFPAPAPCAPRVFYGGGV